MKKLTDKEKSALHQILNAVFHCMYKNEHREYQEDHNDFILTLKSDEMRAALRAARKLGVITDHLVF